MAIRNSYLVGTMLIGKSRRANKSRLFYALLCLINIVAFFGSLSDAKRRGESFRVMALALFKVLLNCILNIPKGLLIVLAAILWLIPEYFFRCLPIKFKAEVRFGRRYALKSGLGIEQKAELEVNELKNVYRDSKRSKHRYNGGSCSPTPLSDFLGIYDMLMAVTEELHYSDVLNLSLVSKGVRHAVLPTEYFEQRRAAFLRYTCAGEKGESCWLCRKQICIVGPFLIRIPSCWHRSHDNRDVDRCHSYHERHSPTISTIAVHTAHLATTRAS